jgi:hypothetical protein
MVGFMKTLLSPRVVGHALARLSGWRNWLSFWAFVENKGANWVRFAVFLFWVRAGRFSGLGKFGWILVRRVENSTAGAGTWRTGERRVIACGL